MPDSAAALLGDNGTLLHPLPVVLPPPPNRAPAPFGLPRSTRTPTPTSATRDGRNPRTS